MTNIIPSTYNNPLKNKKKKNLILLSKEDIKQCVKVVHLRPI
jgi:hypothetical protein